jgi:hypothetical protein
MVCISGIPSSRVSNGAGVVVAVAVMMTGGWKVKGEDEE